MLRSHVIAVGLGEIQVSSQPDVWLVAYGLGSCVGVVIQDRSRPLGGMAHVVLPDSAALGTGGMGERFADRAIPALIDSMVRRGSDISSMRAKVVGGARMFANPYVNGLLDIGARNVQAVKEVLAEAGVPIVAEEVGGTKGRTLRYHIGEGRVYVATLGMDEREI